MQKYGTPFSNWYSSIKDVDKLSKGRIDKIISDEETNFLNLCRNAITALDTNKVVKEIQARKRAQTQKNKRDKEEYIGSTLPNLSELLPKVFESRQVQVYLWY